MRNSIPIVLFLICNFACTQNKSKHITEVSQKELDKVILVDVRTPKEFNEGHLENALNIDWLGDNFAKDFEKIDKKETIYLYCKSGGRSAAATKFLDSLGYENIVDLKGGYSAWKGADN